jgi:copper chaperone CopZ
MSRQIGIRHDKAPSFHIYSSLPCGIALTKKSFLQKEGRYMVRCAFSLMLLAVFLIGASSCSTSGREVNAQITQEKGETRVYEVFGMGCPGCHGGLEKLVLKIPAVQQAEANWKEKHLLVTVKQGSELNDEDVYDAIRRANFTPGERIR